MKVISLKYMMNDGFGVPTIGVGFALINKISDKWEAYEQKELQKYGINLTIEQYEIIKNYASAKTNGDDISDLRSQLNDTDITITPETARKLLQHSIQDKYNIIKKTIGEETWDQLNLAQQVGVMDYAFQRGNILSLKESLIVGDYATTAKIMREVPKDNKALKHRADIRADFVEYGKMEFDGVHIVQAGNTASHIAKSSGISLKELKEFNPDISNIDKISVGQKIRITPPIKQDDKDDTVSMAAAGASNSTSNKEFNPDLSNLYKIFAQQKINLGDLNTNSIDPMNLVLPLIPKPHLFTPTVLNAFETIIGKKLTSDFEKKGFDLINHLEEVRIHEAERNACYERVLKMVLEHMEQTLQKSQENPEQEKARDESNPNMVKDLTNKVLDKIRTKFKELVEDTKVKSEKDNEEEGKRATQLQLETDAKNKKIDIMVHEYHKKIHEFIDKTSRCIVQASDNDGNIENTIEQQINIFLQGAAVDLPITY